MYFANNSSAYPLGLGLYSYSPWIPKDVYQAWSTASHKLGVVFHITIIRLAASFHLSHGYLLVAYTCHIHVSDLLRVDVWWPVYYIAFQLLVYNSDWNKVVRGVMRCQFAKIVKLRAATYPMEKQSTLRRQKRSIFVMAWEGELFFRLRTDNLELNCRTYM